VTTPHEAAITPDDLIEAAHYLRLSDRTVSPLMRKGQLSAARIGRAVRIRQSNLLDMFYGKTRICAGLATHRE
jgi:excisionase family DNA binding protein